MLEAFPDGPAVLAEPPAALLNGNSGITPDSYDVTCRAVTADGDIQIYRLR